jgi:uncharacterized protein YqeY
MSTPEETISLAVREALRGGERERTATLRMLLSEIKNERIRAQDEVDEAGFLRLVRRAVKQRQESATQYTEGGRQELADKELREIAILEDFLPAEVPQAELEQAISELIAENELSGPAAMGQLMKLMMARYAGQVDGGRINQLVRAALAD